MRTAQVIQNQARTMGWTVTEVQRADTGSIYIELAHPSLCSCDDPCGGLCSTRMIRVADHEPNEARYEFRVNTEPDLDVRAGYQVAAVEFLAEQIGREPSSVPYVAAARRREARKAAARTAAETAAHQAQIDRQVTIASARAALTPEHQAVLNEYDRLTGRARKNFRNTGRYRAAMAALAMAGYDPTCAFTARVGRVDAE